MNVLSIGNSFSEDATRYLHRISRSGGSIINNVNLYIGGCSLESHARNMYSEKSIYELQYNGEKTGFYTSLKDALLNRHWDYITLQQVSELSVNYDTYQPYLTEISKYIKQYCPKSKQVIHQTWAYEQGSNRLCGELGYLDYKDMLIDVKKSYKQAGNDIDAYGIIPSGELFDTLLDAGIKKIHRDTYHASLGLGRYALGLLWYSFFSGKDVKDIEFSDFDNPISNLEIQIAKTSVKKLMFV